MYHLRFRPSICTCCKAGLDGTDLGWVLPVADNYICRFHKILHNSLNTLDLIANKRMSRRGIFPFRFRGSCRLEPCFDGKFAPEIVQSAGGFDEGVLKARFEVAINVTDATEDLDSDDTVLDVHP